jgi:hypothetical protein
MSGTYRHFIEPGRKETRGSDIYALARRLLAKGTIYPETRLETWRLAVTGDRCILCMSGKAGELAKWRVVEDDVRGLGLVEYRPFPVHTFASGRPKQGVKVHWHLRQI